jgi:hypothetical protein
MDFPTNKIGRTEENGKKTAVVKAAETMVFYYGSPRRLTVNLWLFTVKLSFLSFEFYTIIKLHFFHITVTAKLISVERLYIWP